MRLRLGSVDPLTREELNQRELAEAINRLSNQYRLDDSEINHWERGRRGPPTPDVIVYVAQALASHSKQSDPGKIRDELLKIAGYPTLEGERLSDSLHEIKQGIGGIAEVTGEIRDMLKGGGSELPHSTLAIAGNSVQKVFLPGILMSAFGTVLNSFSGYRPLMLLGVVGLALVVVCGQTLYRIRRVSSAEQSWGALKPGRGFVVGELLFVSVFVMLSVLLLQSAFTGMDTFGFFTIAAFADKPSSLLLALGVNLLLASVATAIFYGLWTWQFGTKSTGGAYGRASKAVIPPLLLVYIAGALLTTPGGEIYLLAVLVLMAFAFILVVAISDPQVQLGDWEAKFVLAAFVGAIFVLFIAAFTTMLLWFFLVGFVPATGNHLWSWTINWATLGYSPQEYVDRAKVGFLWAMTSGIAYMIFALGGYAMVTVYRHQILPNRKKDSGR